MEKRKHHFKESWTRSLAKTVSYRIAILTLNFVAVLIMTDKVSLAFDFMLVSSLYTIPGYYFHERLWDRLHWGKEKREAAGAANDESVEASAKPV